MTSDHDPRFLAMLVHRGLLDEATMRAALASGDPPRYLVESGVVTAEQWQEWRDTDGGTRPQLSRYELGDLLGEGGTARVFKAKDRKTGEAVALKVLKPSLVSDRGALEAFIAESKLLISLDCPHIVKGLRVAREGDVFFCAMECVDGVCLQDEVGDDAMLDETLALMVVMQIGKALSYLHGRGLVHRDVKPGNIMLAAGDRAVLIDLGFAVTAGQSKGEASDTTAGTVHYISPEQARGQDGLDGRADIYSLGATLYHLVTGSLPFQGESHDEVMAKQVLEALSGGAIRALGLSPHVHYFIEKMMAKDADIRFQDPDDLVAALTRHLATQEREQAAEQDALKKSKSKRRMRRFL